MNTPIIATLRPSHLPYLKELKKAGMTIARLNGSYGTTKWHNQTIDLIRKEIPETSILLDIPGRKLRLPITEIIHVKKNQVINLPIPNWIPDQTHIIFDDGKLSGILRKKIGIQFEQDGQLHPQIGMNIPGVPLQGPLLTAKDHEIITLAREKSVNWIGISFIDDPDVIHTIKSLCNIPCAAKIETSQALCHLEEITKISEMVIVARGDLSVECGLFNVIKHQKQILKTCQQFKKPGVVATGLLSLYPPEQSTIADIQNAILDGASYLLVSSDLPEGKEAITRLQTLRKIIKAL